MGLWITRAEGPKIGAKHPLAEMCFFRLTRALLSGKFALVTGMIFPGSHRTVRPATGGLCCFWASLNSEMIRRDAATAPHKRGV